MKNTASENEARQRKYKYLQMPHIYKISIDEEDKVIELLTYALPILQESVISLRASLKERDMIVFRKQLHKLKGSLGVIDPATLYHHSAGLEDKLRNQDNAVEGTDADLFIDEVEELIREMEVELTNFKR